ncbi:hypothetical protein J518_1287 [Acinetobacter baumannii 1419130]|nr:hypothetical protein J518_1287 [Acinetobacter baumannii 1419130]
MTLQNTPGSWRHTPFRKSKEDIDKMSESSWRHTPFRKQNVTVSWGG